MHLIKQNTVDVQCASRSFSSVMHNELSVVMERQLYPKLAVLLDKYAVENHIWNIDLLEINIQNLSEKNWKNELVEYTLFQIEQYLKANKPLIHEQDNNSNRFNNLLSDNQHAEMLLYQFLKTGMLPENGVANNPEKLIRKINVNDSFVQQLSQYFQNDLNTLIRWIFTMPDALKEKVLTTSLLSGYYPEAITDIVTAYPAKVFTGKNKASIQQWMRFLQWIYVLQQQSLNKKQFYFEELVKASKIHWDISFNELKEFLSQTTTLLKAEKKGCPAQVKAFFKGLEKRLYKSQSVPVYKNQTDTQNITDSTENQSMFTDGGINAVFIKNAGSVILHPFLTSLFEQLDLCNDGKWIKKQDQHKAILLVQYLVTGKEQFFENEMPLNKILCGMPVNNTVNTKLKLTKKEKDKCNNLLEAVIEYWKPLNGSSVEALQQTFLQRDGKIDLKNSGIELWVEEKGYDILLEKLPWAINMVKTPFMEDFLICNWY